jgi:hypothetical protein
MNFISVEEMAEADTTLVPNPNDKRRQPDGSKQ